MKPVTPNFSNINTVLFDLDGTLLDSRDFLMETQFRTLEKHYPGAFTYERVVSRFGCVFPELVRSFDSAGGQLAIDEFCKAKLSGYHTNSPPFPDVVFGLHTLQARGCNLGIVTNQQKEPTLNAMQAYGLDGLFDVIVAWEDVKQGKPSPEGIRQALRHMGAEPSRTAMIGDSEADILAAQRAGVASGWLTWYGSEEMTLCRPDAVFRSFEELLRALGKAALISET